MKKKMWSLLGIMLLALLLAVTQIPAKMMEAAPSATDFELDGTTLVKYTGTASTVSVPASVKTIGLEAFYGNDTMKTVKLPSGLETIEYGAFGYCSALTKVKIPDSVISIGSGAFACNTSLKSVTIGEGVKEMGHGVFAGCTSLSSLKLSKKNTSFLVDKGVLFDKDKTKLYQYLPGKTDSIYNVPSTVRQILKYSFWGCKDLEMVALNSELPEIGGFAFSNCYSLKEIKIPYSVKTIGAKAFADCINLESAELPPSLRSIHETAFDGCMKLTLSGEAGSVAGEYADAYNKKEKVPPTNYEELLKEDVLPEEVEMEIQTDSPESETQLTDTPQEDPGNVLGSTVIVGNQAVVLMSPEKEVQSGKTVTANIIPEQAYYKQKDLTSYTIPEGTTEIGAFAFARSGLTSIVIPEGVTKIGYAAFYHCDDLTQVTLPSTLKVIEAEAFGKTGLTEIILPEGLTDIDESAFEGTKFSQQNEQ